MTMAYNVHCEKCGRERNMGLYDILSNDLWVLQCHTCNTIQDKKFDPHTLDTGTVSGVWMGPKIMYNQSCKPCNRDDIEANLQSDGSYTCSVCGVAVKVY